MTAARSKRWPTPIRQQLEQELLTERIQQLLYGSSLSHAAKENLLGELYFEHCIQTLSLAKLGLVRFDVTMYIIGKLRVYLQIYWIGLLNSLGNERIS